MLPVQPLPKDNGVFEEIAFKKDGELYTQDTLFPKDNIVSTRVLAIHGHKILEVVVSPFQYNPGTQTVHMAPAMDILIELTKEPAQGALKPQKRIKSSAYSNVLTSGIYNLSHAYTLIPSPIFRLAGEVPTQSMGTSLKQGYDP